MKTPKTKNDAADAVQSEHTPGPWMVSGELDNLRVNADSADERACDGIRQVCLVVQGDYEIPCYGEAEANARLIASAPELLAALKQAVIVLEDRARELKRAHNGCGDFSKSPALEAARSAIAKASGQKPERSAL